MLQNQHNTATNNMVSNDYTLSDLDMMLFDFPASFMLVYKNTNNKSDQEIVDALQRGLDKAVEQLPLLGAIIHLDQEKKPLPKASPRPEPLKLCFRRFEKGEYKSYDELAEGCFVPMDFDPFRLLPDGTFTPAVMSYEREVCFMQVNFIPGGGIILAFALCHMTADGGSMSRALGLICECAKACMEKVSIPQHEYCYDRQLFAAPGPEELKQMSMQRLCDRLEDEWCEMFNVFDLAPPPVRHQDRETQHYDPSRATYVGRMYRITSSDASRLKASIKPLVSYGVHYLSTNDCMTSVIFRTLMRIRISRNPSLRSKNWRFLFPTDGRTRSYAPANYFGNAFSLSVTEPLPVGRVLNDDDGLSVIASSIRYATAHVDFAADIKDQSAINAKLLPSGKRAILMPGNFPENQFCITSWAGADTASMDFGIGLPVALRTWNIPMGNMGVTFPDCQKLPGSNSGIYDTLISLPDHEHDLLAKDDEFCTWFQAIGPKA